MAGILFKYFPCCTMLPHSAMLENSSHTSPLTPFFLFIVFDSRQWQSPPLSSFFRELCFLCHNMWQHYSLDNTDQIPPSDSILTPELKIRNYYNPNSIVSYCVVYCLYFLSYFLSCYAYVQLYIKG